MVGELDSSVDESQLYCRWAKHLILKMLQGWLGCGCQPCRIHVLNASFWCVFTSVCKRKWSLISVRKSGWQKSNKICLTLHCSLYIISCVCGVTISSNSLKKLFLTLKLVSHFSQYADLSNSFYQRLSQFCVMAFFFVCYQQNLNIYHCVRRYYFEHRDT